MKRLVNDKGDTITEPKKILKEQKEFYKKLYTSNDKVEFKMNVIPENKISADDKKSMDTPITLDELSKAL